MVHFPTARWLHTIKLIIISKLGNCGISDIKNLEMNLENNLDKFMVFITSRVRWKK